MAEPATIELAAIWEICKTRAGQQLIGAAGAIMAGLLGLNALTYSWGKDAGEKNLAQLQTVKEINFPELNKQTKDAAAELRKASSDFSQLVDANKNLKLLSDAMDKLRAENSTLAGEYAAIKTKLASADNRFEELNKKYALLLLPESEVTVPLNQTIPLLGGGLIVALVDTAVSKATLNVNGTRRDVVAGDILAIPIPGPPKADCKVTVMAVSLNNVKVAYQCATMPLSVSVPPPPPPSPFPQPRAEPRIPSQRFLQ